MKPTLTAEDRVIIRSCKAGYQKALKLAAAERRRTLAAERREQVAERKVREAAELKQARLDEAEEGRAELPAVVLRNGTVKSISLETAVEVIDQYLGALCLDCETSGYWIGHQYYELRTVQLGGEEMAVVLDASDEKQMLIASWALKAAVKLHAHSATADICPVVHAGLIGWDEAWAKMEDSVLITKLTDPKLSGSEADALKKLSLDLLHEYAVSPVAEKAKNNLFKVMKCLVKTDVTTPPERNGWYQVSKNAVVMIRYAGSDVLDLAAVLRILPPLPVSQDVLKRECEAQAICAPVAYIGYPLDMYHIRLKLAEFKAEQSHARYAVEALTGGAITNPSSSKDVLEYLLKQGYELKPDRKTKQPSAGKASLEPYANRGDALARNIIAYRHCTTTIGLLLRPLENLCVQGDSVMRPTVYTINAVTGRMSCVRPNGQQFCYTSDMDILTDQGWKAFSRLDGSERVAQWSAGVIEFITPEAVLHEPYDGPMIRISGEHHEQVVTPEHRVYSKTRDGKLVIEPASSWLKHGAVGKIVDRKFIRGGRLAGRKLNDDERRDLYRAVAVQADGHLLPYETNRVRLQWTKARKIQRARELGFDVRAQGWKAGGKDVYESWCGHAGLERWVNFETKTFNIPALLELDSSELEGFLHEVMIWDGDSTRFREYRQHEDRKYAVDAVEMAAFLSGNSTVRSVYTLNGRNYENVGIFPKAERYASRTNVEEVPSDGMIHCVTVPSGAVIVRSNGKVIVSGNSRQGGIRACVVAGDMDLELIDGKWVAVAWA